MKGLVILFAFALVRMNTHNRDFIQILAPHEKMTKPVMVVVLILLVSLCTGVVTEGAQEKPRALVLTVIANEPDDEESLVRFLVYANELDVVSPSRQDWKVQAPRRNRARD